MDKEEKKKSFGWSLKPTELMARFAIGAPIEFIEKSFKPVDLISFLLGFFIFLANLLINGPRTINASNFDWMENIKYFESPFLYFKDYPDTILQLVMDVTSICFFVAVPLIHFIFLITILWSPEWKDLLSKLQIIQQEMKLSKKFHKIGRQRSTVALLIGILVICFKNSFNNLLMNVKWFSQDVAVFGWKYSFYDCEYVANEMWQSMPLNVQWLPKIARDPMPFAAALLARTSEIVIICIFDTFSFVTAILFEELADSAEDMAEENKIHSNNISTELEEWRRHYDLVCRFIETVNDCFDWILLLQTALGFALPIFDFYKILYTNGQVPRHYFEFGHTVFRFFLFMLIPSYLVSLQVYNSKSFHNTHFNYNKF